MSSSVIQDAKTQPVLSEPVLGDAKLSPDARVAHYERDAPRTLRELLALNLGTTVEGTLDERGASAVLKVLAHVQQGKEVPNELTAFLRSDAFLNPTSKGPDALLEGAPAPREITKPTTPPALGFLRDAVDSMTGAFNDTAQQRIKELEELKNFRGPLPPEMSRRYRAVERMTRDLDGLAELIGDSPHSRALRATVGRLYNECRILQPRIIDAEKAELKYLAGARIEPKEAAARAVEIAASDLVKSVESDGPEFRPHRSAHLKELPPVKGTKIEGFQGDHSKSEHVSHRVGAVRAEAARAKEGLSKSELSHLAQNLIGQLGEAFGNPIMQSLVAELSGAISAVAREIHRIESEDRATPAQSARPADDGHKKGVHSLSA